MERSRLVGMGDRCPCAACAVLRACHSFWAESAPAIADNVVDTVWAAGCRDPHIAEARVVRTAVAGRPAVRGVTGLGDVETGIIAGGLIVAFVGAFQWNRRVIESGFPIPTGSPT